MSEWRGRWIKRLIRNSGAPLPIPQLRTAWKHTVRPSTPALAASSRISSERVVCARLPSIEFSSFWTMLGYYTTPSPFIPTQEKQVVFLRFSSLRSPIFSIFLQDILSLSTQVSWAVLLSATPHVTIASHPNLPRRLFLLEKQSPPRPLRLQKAPDNPSSCNRLTEH